ncbi:hypothetical protein ACFODL_15450 [Phenylobacterium terrae]|uniref:Uncharacterized protein n=1 Tax=Phenylobacterium terrae TaxID=2665495 RepID=A0ABW4N6X3_9CAUL
MRPALILHILFGLLTRRYRMVVLDWDRHGESALDAALEGVKVEDFILQRTFGPKNRWLVNIHRVAR